MAHNFVKQFDGSKICSKCGDEIGVSIERGCPYAGNSSPYFIELILHVFCICIYFAFDEFICLQQHSPVIISSNYVELFPSHVFHICIYYPIIL